MPERQPVRRQLVLRHQRVEGCDDRVVRRQIQNRIAQLTRMLPGEVRFCRIDLDAFEQQNVSVEPQARAFRHQPHPEKIRELQRGPVAPDAISSRGAQAFGESVRQDRFGFRIADAIRQLRDRIETIDDHLVAGRDLRTQAQPAQAVERAVPEGDDFRSQASPTRQTKAQDQAHSFSFASQASIGGLDAWFIANAGCIKGQKAASRHQRLDGSRVVVGQK